MIIGERIKESAVEDNSIKNPIARFHQVDCDPRNNDASGPFPCRTCISARGTQNRSPKTKELKREGMLLMDRLSRKRKNFFPSSGPEKKSPDAVAFFYPVSLGSCTNRLHWPRLWLFANIHCISLEILFNLFCSASNINFRPKLASFFLPFRSSASAQRHSLSLQTIVILF